MKLNLILVLAAGCLSASAAAISNGTFDNSCAGWTGVANDGAGGCRSADGNPGGMFIINATAGVVPEVNQTVTGLVVGQSYVLSGDYRNHYNCCTSFPAANAFGVMIDGVQREFTVLSGGTSAAWQSFAFTFTYTGTSSLLRLTSQRNNLDADVAVDNIVIADAGGPVPEPSTVAMMGAALIALALGRRRFRG